jgi:hypothetical protein
MTEQLLSSATAEWNSGDFNDETAWVCEPDEVVTTAETLENFICSKGKPHETIETQAGNLHIWHNQQSRPGCVRGDLFLLDVGNVRLSYFDGES